MTAKKIKKFIEKMENKYNARDIDIADILIKADDKHNNIEDVLSLTERYFKIQCYKNAPNHHFLDTYTNLLYAEINSKIFTKDKVLDSWNTYKSILRSCKVSQPELYPWLTKDYHRLCRKVVDYK